MTQPNPPPPPSPPAAVAQHHQLLSLDDTIEQCIGEFGWNQFLQSAIVSFTCFFDAQQTFITLFTDQYPKWSCNNKNNYDHLWCKDKTNLCQLPDNSWSWDLPAHTSTISQWSLQCASPFIRGLPASSFLLGCLVGGLVLATLADSKMGRKNMLVLSCLIMSISGGLTAISRNIWMYAGFRFISGFGRPSIGTCAFVLATELVGKKWRGKIGTLGFSFFTLGFLSLPLIAYLLKGSSWRLMYVFTCCPCACYSLLVYVTAHESPRWLFIEGKKQEFVKTIRSLTTTTTTTSFYGDDEEVEWATRKLPPQENNHFYSALKKLLKGNKWAVKRLLAVMMVGFGTGMAYYGSPLGLDNLPFNLYLSVALNASVEFLASWAVFFTIEKLERKSWLVGLSLFSGACSVGSVLGRLDGVQIGMEMMYFMGMCMEYNVFMFYMSELFPTCVRNTALSMVRAAGSLGGFIGPMLVAVIGKKHGLLCYGVFGVTISLTALCVVWLPETKGRTLCDTMEEEEEEERKGNEAKNCVFC